MTVHIRVYEKVSLVECVVFVSGKDSIHIYFGNSKDPDYLLRSDVCV
jgi:hypothetical protein